MRIIASTKVLPIDINRAIKKGLNNFVLYKKTNTLKFYSNTYKVDSCVEFLEDGKEDSLISKFNHLQWYKLQVFLTSLIEQPIIIDINKINDDEVEIKLSQFIHKI